MLTRSISSLFRPLADKSCFLQMAPNSTTIHSCDLPLSIARNTASSTSYWNTNYGAWLEELEDCGFGHGRRRGHVVPKVRRGATSTFTYPVQILIFTTLVLILQPNIIHILNISVTSCPLGDNPQILNAQWGMGDNRKRNTRTAIAFQGQQYVANGLLGGPKVGGMAT